MSLGVNAFAKEFVGSVNAVHDSGRAEVAVEPLNKTTFQRESRARRDVWRDWCRWEVLLGVVEIVELGRNKEREMEATVVEDSNSDGCEIPHKHREDVRMYGQCSQVHLQVQHDVMFQSTPTYNMTSHI